MVGVPLRAGGLRAQELLWGEFGRPQPPAGQARARQGGALEEGGQPPPSEHLAHASPERMSLPASSSRAESAGASRAAVGVLRTPDLFLIGSSPRTAALPQGEAPAEEGVKFRGRALGRFHSRRSRRSVSRQDAGAGGCVSSCLTWVRQGEDWLWRGGGAASPCVPLLGGRLLGCRGLCWERRSTEGVVQGAQDPGRPPSALSSFPAPSPPRRPLDIPKWMSPQEERRTPPATEGRVGRAPPLPWPLGYPHTEAVLPALEVPHLRAPPQRASVLLSASFWDAVPGPGLC